MRLITLLLLPIIFICTGCSDTKIGEQPQVADLTFNDVSSTGTTLKIPITYSSAWTTTSSTLWCIQDKKDGSGNYELIVTVSANIDKVQRSATITIKSDEGTKIILINQQGSESVIDNYHYKLPVIFHVFYKSAADHNQYIDKGRLAKILENVNNIYKNSGVDMNFEFTLATQTPSGDTLDEIGVQRTLWSGEYPIDIDDFMSNNTRKYTHLLWDPNQYINVMIYNFTEDVASGSTTLGISHLAYTSRNFRLEGTSHSPQPQLTMANLSYAHCISINSLYIYNQSSATYYNSADVNVTLAHELGHYLGLHHTFDEDSNSSGCKDTDYCLDTPTYNRKLYMASFNYSIPFKELIKREDCNRGEFISHNVMDYMVSLSDRFSADQLKRVRHVLTYSPLIPGPKLGVTKSSDSSDEVIDLPFQVMK